ncbi:hypothetical protein H0H92_005830 [Tricholoma furcatifolium]|nr:hypothetical protein H0H92_005830 [Tricholoma furcatifolium]
MNVFNKSNSNEISNSTISSVARDQNVAENMTIVHQVERQQDSRKRERQMSGDSYASPSTEVIRLADESDVIQNIGTPSARSKSTRPPAKRSRADDDRARDGATNASEPVYNFIGRDSYTAETLQIFSQTWDYKTDDTGARQKFTQQQLPIVAPPSPVFTGREDILSELEVYFKQSSLTKHEQLRCVLYGLGGAGKTQIMRKFCADYGNR